MFYHCILKIDLFSSTAASVSNRLTHLLTYLLTYRIVIILSIYRPIIVPNLPVSL